MNFWIDSLPSFRPVLTSDLRLDTLERFLTTASQNLQVGYEEFEREQLRGTFNI